MKSFTSNLIKLLDSNFKDQPGETVCFYEKNFETKMNIIKINKNKLTS